ncbi:MAG: hypothetical protein ABIG44_10075 [Planctomycetota bacterium]
MALVRSIPTTLMLSYCWSAAVWTERMLTALEEGFKGGVWFRLIDQVFSPRNLQVAFTKAQANSGAAGVNRPLKSVVREICTLRSVGAGGGQPPPATRREIGSTGLPYPEYDFFMGDC